MVEAGVALLVNWIPPHLLRHVTFVVVAVALGVAVTVGMEALEHGSKTMRLVAVPVASSVPAI
jgi:hypothetical protein